MPNLTQKEHRDLKRAGDKEEVKRILFLVVIVIIVFLVAHYPW